MCNCMIRVWQCLGFSALGFSALGTPGHCLGFSALGFSALGTPGHCLGFSAHRGIQSLPFASVSRRSVSRRSAVALESKLHLENIVSTVESQNDVIAYMQQACCKKLGASGVSSTSASVRQIHPHTFEVEPDGQIRCPSRMQPAVRRLPHGGWCFAVGHSQSA
jgi:hypothetical protein